MLRAPNVPLIAQGFETFGSGELKRPHILPRDYTKVGKYLADGRRYAKLTQREVSLELGYSSAQFISNFERGVALPPLRRMKKLLEIYRLDPSELIEPTIDAEKMIMRKSLRKK